MAEHNNITDPYLHEPKGVAIAADGEIYIADGAGSGAWQKAPDTSLSGIATSGTEGQILVSDGAGGFEYRSTPHGQFHYEDLAVPATGYTLGLLVGAANAQKLAPSTIVGGSPVEFTEGADAKLTYTGEKTRHFHIAASIAFDHAAGAARNVVIEIWKNGVGTGTKLPGTMLMTCNTTTIVSTAVHGDTMLATGDYLELAAYTVASTATIRLNSLYLFAVGMTES